MTPAKDVVLALLRIHSISEGADICDRCGEPIWPEFELVRCDSCVGRHGAPDRERMEEAARRHRPRIMADQRETAEEFHGGDR